MRVLVVEDDVRISRGVAKVLRGISSKVTVVHSICAASRIELTYDVGVFDIFLEDGDGIELARELLMQGNVRSAVFFSGCVDQEVLSRARAVGSLVGKDERFECLQQAVLQATGYRERLGSDALSSI